MKRNALIGLFAFMLVIGSATAAIVPYLIDWQDTIEMSPEQIAQVRESAGVSLINISISEITCDNEECWASLNQDGVINTEWRNSRNYCTDYDNETDECFAYKDYTVEELQQQAKDYVEMRVSAWADAEIQRKTRKAAKEQISGKGSIEALVPAEPKEVQP